MTGSFHLHAIDDNGVFFIDDGAKRASLQITSLDAAVVSAGKAHHTTRSSRACS
jgi:hypothetical protein